MHTITIMVKLHVLCMQFYTYLPKLSKFIRGTVHRNLHYTPPDTAQDHLVSHSHTLTLNTRVWLHEIKDHLQEACTGLDIDPILTGSMIWIPS